MNPCDGERCPQSTVTVGEGRLTIEDVVRVAKGQRSLSLSRNTRFIERIRRGADFLDKLLAEDGVIYGVTTGYGDSCTVSVPPSLVVLMSVATRRRWREMAALGVGWVSLSVVYDRMTSGMTPAVA